MESDSSPVDQPRDVGSHRVEIYSTVDNIKLALYEFAATPSCAPRILVLKLDHLGDFLIGLPALIKLRATFPKAHVTLICGPWNVTTARSLGVADEIRAYEYFPENAKNWGGDAIEDLHRFCEVCRGHFDIALDLRVDEDTRPLLRHVDAALRCGIGARSRHPYLNIVLPGQFETRERRQMDNEPLVFRPNAFHSRMPIRTAFFHATNFSVTDSHLIYGPYSRLPLGQLRAEFSFELLAPLWSLRRVEVAVEVVRDGASDVIGFKRKKWLPNRKLTVVALDFSNDDVAARYEFRVFIGGHPRPPTQLRFFGVRIEVIEKQEQQARFLAAELHIGEQLSLLVALVGERLRPFYQPDLLDRLAVPPKISNIRPPRIPASAKCIVIAPFSNSTVRDWPIDYYNRLIRLLLSDIDCYILLVASRGQAERMIPLCEDHVDDDRLVNLAGQTDWAGLAYVLRQADLVIANNSGIAHLAAAANRPTLAIYSGSHQPQEWGPRGQMARAVTAVISCSPCGYENLELCPHNHQCMTSIEPKTVAQHARGMLANGPSTVRSTRSSSWAGRIVGVGKS
jgi:ADP-heptose:LPS heptosyltransferase